MDNLEEMDKFLETYNFTRLNQKETNRDFPGGPVVNNLPYNAGDAGSIPSQGTKIPHAMGQLSPCTTTTELTAPQLELKTTEPTSSGTHEPQLQSPHALEPACHN